MFALIPRFLAELITIFHGTLGSEKSCFGNTDFILYIRLYAVTLKTIIIVIPLTYEPQVHVIRVFLFRRKLYSASINLLIILV